MEFLGLSALSQFSAYFTSKETFPPPSVRIRDNQRRSRARRKELIDDLKQRLRVFENEGAQATVEVQIAAQKVAKENDVLRSLLREHGVTDLEIEDSIRSKLFPSDVPSAEKSWLKAKELSSQLLLPQDIRSGRLSNPRFVDGRPSKLVTQDDTHMTTSTTLSHQVYQGDMVTTSQAPSPGSTKSCPQWHDTLTTAPLYNDVAIQPIEAQEVDSHRHSADDTTSCEIAASIIASMRGHVDAEEARAELGCSSSLSCMVKNTTIFQRMDR